MSKPQVIIVRKDKRIRHKFLHAAAFAVTGGASGLVTAAEAANHASYNARTRKLQEQAEGAPQPQRRSRWRRPSRDPEFLAEHVPSSPEYRERHQTLIGNHEDEKD